MKLQVKKHHLLHAFCFIGASYCIESLVLLVSLVILHQFGFDGERVWYCDWWRFQYVSIAMCIACKRFWLRIYLLLFVKMTMSLSLRMFYCNIELTQVNSRINSKYEKLQTDPGFSLLIGVSFEYISIINMRDQLKWKYDRAHPRG